MLILLILCYFVSQFCNRIMNTHTYCPPLVLVSLLKNALIRRILFKQRTSVLTTRIKRSAFYPFVPHAFWADINPCDISPCQNGATCSRVGDTSFTCTCIPGFTDRLCGTGQYDLLSPLIFSMLIDLSPLARYFCPLRQPE